MKVSEERVQLLQRQEPELSLREPSGGAFPQGTREGTSGASRTYTTSGELVKAMHPLCHAPVFLLPLPHPTLQLSQRSGQFENISQVSKSQCCYCKSVLSAVGEWEPEEKEDRSELFTDPGVLTEGVRWKCEGGLEKHLWPS